LTTCGRWSDAGVAGKSLSVLACGPFSPGSSTNDTSVADGETVERVLEPLDGSALPAGVILELA